MKVIEKFSFYTALFGSKTVNKGLHLMHRAGTSLPGVVALKISPKFISFLSKYCEKNIVTITGTNGKTTTAGLFAHILKTNEEKILHNEKGANMLSGIASSLAVNFKPFTKFDYAVLESDEAYLTKLYDFLEADYLLVTNLFRDQLDRYGELDTTAKKIQEAIKKNLNLKIFVNADDPMLQTLGISNERIFFGFEEINYKDNLTASQAPAESVVCNCKTDLTYEERYYAHVGKYYCTNCGKKRPEPDYKGYANIYADYCEITVEHYGETSTFKTGLVGLYNAYNALASISLAMELGISKEVIQKALDSYKSIFGRAEKFSVDGKNVLVQLIKNPTGASEVLRTVNQKTSKRLLIIINDNYADGRDVSWLWDADFELLKDYPEKIVISGLRANDMAVRMKYAGFDQNKIVIKHNISEAIKYSLEEIEQGEQLLIMPTYTALLEMQKILKR